MNRREREELFATGECDVQGSGEMVVGVGGYESVSVGHVGDLVDQVVAEPRVLRIPSKCRVDPSQVIVSVLDNRQNILCETSFYRHACWLEPSKKCGGYYSIFPASPSFHLANRIIPVRVRFVM